MKSNREQQIQKWRDENVKLSVQIPKCLCGQATLVETDLQVPLVKDQYKWLRCCQCGRLVVISTSGQMQWYKPERSGE